LLLLFACIVASEISHYCNPREMLEAARGSRQVL
jgi:hypothetical protein